jgi:hypothetical protein
MLDIGKSAFGNGKIADADDARFKRICKIAEVVNQPRILAEGRNLLMRFELRAASHKSRGFSVRHSKFIDRIRRFVRKYPGSAAKSGFLT